MEGDYGQPAFFAAYWIFWLIIYVYFAICFMMIANKTNTSNAWLAWIPILNIFLMLMIAKKPLWWFILLCKHSHWCYYMDGHC